MLQKPSSNSLKCLPFFSFGFSQESVSHFNSETVHTQGFEKFDFFVTFLKKGNINKDSSSYTLNIRLQNLIN